MKPKKDNVPRKIVPYSEFRQRQRDKKYGKSILPELTPEEITRICTPEIGFDEPTSETED